MKKRILYTTLTGYPNPNSGGPNKVIDILMKSLSKEEYDIDYFSKYCFKEVSFRENEHTNRHYVRSRIDSLYKNSHFYRQFVNSAWYLEYHYKKIEQSFRKFADSYKYDVIHAHDPCALSFFASKPGRKILSIHSKGTFTEEFLISHAGEKYNELQAKISCLERKGLEIADQVIFPSKAAMNMYTQNEFTSIRHKSTVIYNGVDLEKISRIHPDDRSNQIVNKIGAGDGIMLNVAEHTPQKNIKLLLEVLAAIKSQKKDWRLIQVGSGVLTEELKKYTEYLNIQDRVLFLECLDNDNIIRLMKSVDVVIMVSQKVVFDYVILEAMACGAVVMASDEGGNKEVIQNGVNGYMFKKLTVDDIVCRLLDYSIQVKDKAKVLIGMYDVDRMINNYDGIY